MLVNSKQKCYTSRYCIYYNIMYNKKMLFEGQGNAEERPEYQIMIKRKGSNLYNVINLRKIKIKDLIFCLFLL